MGQTTETIMAGGEGRNMLERTRVRRMTTIILATFRVESISGSSGKEKARLCTAIVAHVVGGGERGAVLV